MQIVNNLTSPSISHNRTHTQIHSVLIHDLSQQLVFYRHSLENAVQHNLKLLKLRQQHPPPTQFKTFQIKIEEQQPKMKLSSTKEEHLSVKQQFQSLSDAEIMVNQNKRRKREHADKCQNDINQTKNIPKNYGKAILSFIQKNVAKFTHLLEPILTSHNLTIADLLEYIKRHKKQVNSISYLKLIWGHKDQNNPIYKCVRILSFIFLRKFCLPYIFNSRVKNHTTHIKYRIRIIEGLLDPSNFTCIKQF